jgi:two-component system, OmpR family, phosphate regulon sensor histidine kinase PhoR
MTKRIFGKLILSVVLLLALWGFVAEYLVSHITEQNLQQDQVASLREKTRLVRSLLERVDEVDFPSVIDRLAEDANARITAISSDGSVIADSEADPAEMENHAARPEFREALAGREGVSTRRSDTIGVEFLYVAIPMRDQAVRLALPLATIAARSGEIRSQILWMMVLALVPSILIAAWKSKTLSSTLSEIIAYSHRLADGEFHAAMPEARGGELGELATQLRSAGKRLRGMFEQLQDERSRFAAAVNGIGEGILVADRRLTLVLSNPAVEQMFPGADFTKGEPVEQWLPPEIPAIFREVLENGEMLAVDVQIASPNQRSWKVSCTPILSKKGKVQAVAAVFYDITELERVDRMRKDFVINVSHELRTPLAAIQGYAETLLDGAIDDPNINRRFVKIVWRNAERLAQLTADLMTLSQVEVNTREFHFKPHSVAEILQEAGDSISMILEKKSIALEIDPVDPNLIVECDSGAIHQVLTNLLDNAAKYTPENGMIVLRAEASGEAVEFSVRDTGAGIAPEHIPRLFERFYRVDKARSRALGGTGLGLAIVKHLVLAHRGTVDVSSVLGEGATFSFRLPLLAASVAPMPAPQSALIPN